MSNLKKINIDGIEVEVDGAMTIIQAAEVAGVEIPRFCYHERLTIAGNCRMCLVEVVGGYVAEHGYDYEKEFLYGLDLILDGLESRLNGN